MKTTNKLINAMINKYNTTDFIESFTDSFEVDDEIEHFAYELASIEDFRDFDNITSADRKELYNFILYKQFEDFRYYLLENFKEYLFDNGYYFETTDADNTYYDFCAIKINSLDGEKNIDFRIKSTVDMRLEYDTIEGFTYTAEYSTDNIYNIIEEIKADFERYEYEQDMLEQEED